MSVSQALRHGSARDAIDGVVPQIVALPESPEELAKILAVASQDRQLTVLRGGGSKLEWGRVPDRIDLVIGTEKLEDPFLMTTHTLPLSYFVQSLREFVPQVDLIGVQPQIVAFGFPVSAEVTRAVENLYEGLKQSQVGWSCL